MLSGCLRLGAAARRLASDRSAAVAIEYGLIAGLICIAILGALGGTHDSVTAMYELVMERVSAALTGKN